MAKSAQAFRSIGEVAKLIGVAPHVLRYWETQLPQLSPAKRADGRRYYRPEDVELAAGLCAVMREDGMTARGAARLIAQDKGAAIRARGAERLATLAAEAEAPVAAPRTQRRRGPAPPAAPLASSALLVRMGRVSAMLRGRPAGSPARFRDVAERLRLLLAA